MARAHLRKQRRRRTPRLHRTRHPEVQAHLDLQARREEQAVTLVGGVTVMAGSGANVLGDPRVALAWMVNDLVRRGRGLARGQFVTTGTCTTPLPLTEACEVTAEFGRLGRVVLSIV